MRTAGEENLSGVGVQQIEEDAEETQKSGKAEGNLFSKLLGENNNRSCQDRIIISVENPVYQIWKISVVMVCIVSSYIYAYVAAFGTPEPGSTQYYLDYVFEAIFWIDIIVRKLQSPLILSIRILA